MNSIKIRRFSLFAIFLLLTIGNSSYSNSRVDSSKQLSTVLIYYANETHLNDQAKINYKKLIEILKADSKGAGPTIAKQLVDDLEKFPRSVEEEILAIKSLAAKYGKINISIFSNNLSSQGLFEYFKVNKKHFQSDRLPLLKSDNYILKSHPNGHPQTFSDALKAVALKFPPQAHSYILITKSHGNSFYIFIPRITLRHEKFSAQKILKIANSQFNPGEIPPWMDGMGTSKKQYHDVLRKAGEKGMDFQLVFAESCKSRIGLEELPSLPPNITTFVSPSQGVDYKTINYDALFAKEDPALELKSQLAKKFPGDIAQKIRKKGSLMKTLIWWIPLILLSFFLIARKYLKSQSTKT